MSCPSPTTAFCLSTVLALSAPTAAQSLVADINQTSSFPASSHPGSLTAAGGALLFNANGAAGDQLWRSDGTASGTLLVDPRGVRRMEALGPKAAVFVTELQSNQQCLVRTNGTVAGTWDLPVPAGEVRSLVRVGREVAALVYYSSSATGQQWFEVWVTDGSVTGTRSCGTFPTSSSGEGSLAASDDQLFLAVRDDTFAWHLHSAPAATTCFQEIAQPKNPSSLTGVGEELVFAADTPALGRELWISDGTAAGTQVLDLEPGPGSSSPGVSLKEGGLAYFSATTTALGTEFWTTDGTVAGTSLLADLNPGPASTRSFEYAGVIGGKAILEAKIASQRYLVALSQNAAPVLLYPGMIVTAAGTQLGGDLLFGAYGGPEGFELWATDGTVAGTRLVDDINAAGDSSPGDFVAIAGQVLFRATGPDGTELWASDGTTAGTRQVIDLYPGSHTPSSGATPVGRFGDQLFLIAADAKGAELWVTDGTSNGTTRFKDLEPGPGSSHARGFHFADGYFVFQASTSAGKRLWSSSGTPASTLPIGPEPTFDEKATTASNEVVFSSGGDLWITDGTAPGTRRLRNFSGANQLAQEIAAWRGLVYFWGPAPGGDGAWVTDGTAAGTRLVWDPASGNGTTRIASGFVGSGDEVFFLAAGGPSLELWATDGDIARTRRVAVTDPGHDSVSNPLLEAGGRLFFFGNSSASGGLRLYASDGVAGLTSLVTLNSDPAYFQAVGPRVVFSPSGNQLWASDGQATGTYVIRQVSNPTSNSVIQHVGAPGDNTLFFTVLSDTGARREWVTDGTGRGTRPLPGLRFPGIRGPGLRLGAQFIYGADHPLYGHEPFTRPLSDFDDYASEVYGRSCGTPLSIGLEGVPRASASSPFAIALGGAPPLAPAWLLWSQARAFLPVGSCILYLGGSLGVIPTSTDQDGEARVSIPPSPALINLQVDFQYALPGPSLSPALEIVGAP